MPKKTNGDHDPETGVIAYRYPIDWHLNALSQANTAAMRAVTDDNLIVGSRIYNFANPVEVKAFYAEVGEDAIGPLDDGVHHLFWMYTDVERDEPIAVLVPQDHVPWFLLGVAIRDSVWTAQNYLGGPGALPNHDPTVVRPDGWQPPDQDDDDQDGQAGE